MLPSTSSAAFTTVSSADEPRGWRPVFRLVRLPNLLLMALCLFLVRACLLQTPRPLLTAPFGLLILASLCVAAAGYIINDYYDVKIDSINRPGRLVVGRVINRRHAMMAHLVLTGMGVLVAGALSPLLGLVHLGSALLLWGYSARFKRLPLVGNLSIGTLTAALVLLPELQLRTGQTAVWVYALAAFLLTVVREIIKDIEDMRGDAAHKCRTLPIVWGVARTKWVTGFFLLNLLVLIGAASAQALFVDSSRTLGVWLFITVLAPLLGLAWRLLRADRKLHFTTLSAWCKWIMLAGVLSMLWVVAGR